MKETFAVLNQMVADGAIEGYAIAGAVGAMFYVEPFSTHDIDVLVVVPEFEDKLIAELPGWKYLSSRGYREIRGEGVVVEGWPVQFLSQVAVNFEILDDVLQRHSLGGKWNEFRERFLS